MAFKIFVDFVEVAPLDQVPPGQSAVFTVAGKTVAVFNVAGTPYAIDDACPHFGASLSNGKLDGTTVICAMHGMKIDVTNGCFAGRPESGVASYPVKVVDGKILVAV